MERLNQVQRNTFIVAGILIVAGLATIASPKVNLSNKTEAWMETQAPVKVGDYVFKGDPMSDKPNQSYKVAESTYTELKPFGIVGRIYSNDSKKFDVMLIAGNSKGCFHDNRVCFSSQGYTITKQEQLDIDTERGKVPATFLTMQNRQRGDIRAVMFYKGPTGAFYPLPKNLTWAMFFEQMKLSNNLDSVFYRIIPLHEGATNEELVAFTKEYLAAAQKTSGGFF